MTATRPNRDDPRDRTGTLGALLYADASKTPVPESEWVALVQGIAARDELALHALYERTHRIAFTLIMRITGNQATAEELTLDVFQDVWRRAADYDPTRGTVIGWIMNQARSRAIDRHRFENRKKRVNHRAQQPYPASIPADIGAALERNEQSALLREALGSLTADERLVIETAFFGELTHAETAARLDQPLGTVKTRIRSGLHKLRQALAKEVEPR